MTNTSSPGGTWRTYLTWGVPHQSAAPAGLAAGIEVRVR